VHDCRDGVDARDSRRADSSTYYTVMYPKEFVINWKAFYDKGEPRTAEIRKYEHSSPDQQCTFMAPMAA
jgi:hypothetical protein